VKDGTAVSVLLLPYFGRENPYQRELAQALRALGLTVRSDVDLTHPLLNTLRRCGELDVLHLHWTSPFLISKGRARSLVKAALFLVTLLCVKSQGVKIVWTVHDWLDHERRDPQLEWRLHRLLCHIYDQIIVHCAGAREHITAVYRLPEKIGEKVTVVPHGNFVSSYENTVGQDQARRQLGFGARDTVFLYFGKIRPYKGVLSLTRAFKRLSEDGARLLIVGEPATEALGAQVARDCASDQRIATRLAFVPDGDIQLTMNAADAVVLPFRDVLTSGSIMLAMSFGKAVIAPSLGCLREHSKSPGVFLYDPSADDGLLRCMRKAFHVDLTERGRRNYEHVMAFGWDTIAERTLAVYRRCFAEP
jgi:glycosyltransferase involved in cell wall biosynthesis